MSKKLTIKFTGNIETLIARAKQTANEHGAEFSGNTVAGTFSGKGVSGVYNVDNSQIIVKIDDKPFWAPWCLIESSINNFFK
jgi:hypothetical protein